jgi:ABC-type transporter lipoprotein component MlaA
MMGRYSEELALHFKEMKTYVKCNMQGQKLDPWCEINKHIFVFTNQLYIIILVVYNDVHQFSNNRAFVAK